MRIHTLEKYVDTNLEDLKEYAKRKRNTLNKDNQLKLDEFMQEIEVQVYKALIMAHDSIDGLSKKEASSFLKELKAKYEEVFLNARKRIKAFKRMGIEENIKECLNEVNSAINIFCFENQESIDNIRNTGKEIYRSISEKATDMTKYNIEKAKNKALLFTEKSLDKIKNFIDDINIK